MFLRNAKAQRARAAQSITSGWRSSGLNETVAELKGKGVTVTSEPRPLTLANKTTINFACVAGPAAARIELVARPGRKPSPDSKK